MAKALDRTLFSLFVRQGSNASRHESSPILAVLLLTGPSGAPFGLVDALGGGREPGQEGWGAGGALNKASAAIGAESMEALLGTGPAESAFKTADPGLSTVRSQINVTTFTAWAHVQHRGVCVHVCGGSGAAPAMIRCKSSGSITSMPAA